MCYPVTQKKTYPLSSSLYRMTGSLYANLDFILSVQFPVQMFSAAHNAL